MSITGALLTPYIHKLAHGEDPKIKWTKVGGATHISDRYLRVTTFSKEILEGRYVSASYSDSDLTIKLFSNNLITLTEEARIRALTRTILIKDISSIEELDDDYSFLPRLAHHFEYERPSSAKDIWLIKLIFKTEQRVSLAEEEKLVEEVIGQIASVTYGGTLVENQYIDPCSILHMMEGIIGTFWQ